MNLAAWWKWNLDDVDTKFPKNSIPNWFLTQIYHHTTNGNHPYPGVLALVVYFHFGWEKNHETTFPKSLPTFRLPVVMALTVGTRVAGILIQNAHVVTSSTFAELHGFSLILKFVLFVPRANHIVDIWICLILFRYWRMKYTILEVNIIIICTVIHM